MPSAATLDKRLEACDKPGEHLWILMASWHLTDPERPGEVFLDIENLLIFTSPGCFKCELPYSRKLARMPCRGKIDWD